MTRSIIYAKVNKKVSSGTGVLAEAGASQPNDAEFARQKAELAKQKAELDKARAEIEKDKAEIEKAMAEIERARAEIEKAALRNNLWVKR